MKGVMTRPDKKSEGYEFGKNLWKTGNIIINRLRSLSDTVGKSLKVIEEISKDYKEINCLWGLPEGHSQRLEI